MPSNPSTILPLSDLIDKIARLYKLPARPIDAAKQLDRQALSYIGQVVGQRAALLTAHEIYEVTKWGLANASSRYPQVRALASRRDRAEAAPGVAHLQSLGMAIA
jgi:hypothetical protein